MQPSFRLVRWGSSVLPLGTRQCSLRSKCHPAHYSIRTYATADAVKDAPPSISEDRRRQPPATASTRDAPDETRARPGKAPQQDSTSPVQPSRPADNFDEPPSALLKDETSPSKPSKADRLAQKRQKKPVPVKKTYKSQLPTLPSPPPANARKSAKLAALHARLALPAGVPLETLGRCLVDKTADPDPRFNNHHLSNLGNDLLGYYIGEHLVCHYPRLPMAVLQAAIHAHVGPKSLLALAHGWGVEAVAEPGGEVDPGLLQFRRAVPTRNDPAMVAQLNAQAQERSGMTTPARRTLESASSYFCRAVVGVVYLHGGAQKAKEFVQAHFLSRHLDISSLFTFDAPCRDLSKLCAREGFESPVARIVSETGRLSKYPVYVVGVFSGRDMLGQDAGSSLNEARFKAAAKALKGWYLYSPRTAVGGGEIMVPSAMEGSAGKGLVWRKPHIDDGEIIT